MTFNYTPLISSNRVRSVRQVFSSVKGEFKLRSLDGINTEKDMWDLTFMGDLTYINQIDTALRTHLVTGERLEWVDPYGADKLWSCEEWSLYFEQGKWFLKAMFKEEPL